MSQSMILDQRYELLTEAGHGGSATVWQARDRQTGAVVAVKQMRPAEVDLEAIQRLAQEVKILEELDHPCIVRVFDTGVVQSAPYVVMEWIEGLSLRDRLEDQPRRRLSLTEAVHLVEQIGGALAEAHRHQVVHRDLKPENVLLRAPHYRAVKIVDFGMAKLIGAGAANLTQSGFIFGTPHYMAPERARGKPVNGAADVYALGVMTYEMLAGRRPFEGRSPVKLLAKQIDAPVPGIPGLSNAVLQVLLTALAKTPENRPAADEFALALQHAAGG
jgi:serine/threonine protein kinase